MKSVRSICFATAALVTVAFGPTLGAAAPLGDADAPIRIALNEWTGQNITAHLAGQLLEKLGYKVQYQTAGAFPQWIGMQDGSIDMTPELWTNNLGDIYPKMLAAKEVEVVGDLGLNARDGWGYTDATKEACPGLPDWKALLEPSCAAALATAETLPNGRLLDYPADWGTASANEIADFKLPMTAVPAGSEGALVAELQAAAAANKPLLMRFWAPHWILTKVKLNWLDMPPCDAKDGARCILPSPVIKVVRADFGKKWPAAYDFMKLYQLGADDQQKMIAEVDQDKKEIGAVVAAWIGANSARWSPSIDAAKK
ncbi:ABC transporter substrate-binding protein [Rhizobium sp. KVB221]|uniref:ABC transporter substrate-binding protein n=1 Tax=Rhizobium setariae TaxID=2801340 RepID=A0A936YMU7_9HYPH|nr:ABC transporter substrate-binding protein [Rhizobium setariae]MBL0373439.1 ABC transporter substrate-binding protein [Rhizobium setariae]